MRALIVGGGVIGTSIAYRLAERGVKATVVERTGIACAASGKSGGFLALDWCDGSPLEGLARRSFALHGQLADDTDEDWGYRRLDTYTGALRPVDTLSSAGLAWTSPALHVRGRLGTPESTGQVDPAAFTMAMMRAAIRHGADLHSGAVTGLLHRAGRVVGVEMGEETLEADVVVIAMGPWTMLATNWLPLPPVFGLKGHSVVFDTGHDVPPEALFLQYEEASGSMLTPEVFPRANGTTYVCAVSSEAPLPVDPAHVEPDDGAIERLLELCRRISPALTRSRVLATQACFRPITRDGLPIIGAIPNAPGAYVATGHSVWGILNAPATAEAIAQLILDGTARNVDLSRFDPKRFPSARRVPTWRDSPSVTSNDVTGRSAL